MVVWFRGGVDREAAFRRGPLRRVLRVADGTDMRKRDELTIALSNGGSDGASWIARLARVRKGKGTTASAQTTSAATVDTYPICVSRSNIGAALCHGRGAGMEPERMRHRNITPFRHDRADTV